MKNKKNFSIVIFIFCFFINNNSFSNEIKFETPEIKVFKNGNLLKAEKGGKAITDKGFEITAEKFEYDKINFLLTANKNVLAKDNLKKITIKAENLIYNEKKMELTAEKEVEVIDQLNKTVIKANKITYFINLEKILTKGKTVIEVDDSYLINSSDLVFLRNKLHISSNEFTTLKDNEENFYTANNFGYFINSKILKGKKISLFTKDKNKYFFEDAMVNLNTKEIHGKDLEVNFHNTMFDNSENQPRLKGNIAYSNIDKTKVSKGVFTTCKKRNSKCPPWLVKAKEVEHNKLNKTIYYKNAWLKIYDVPVMYFPKFFHPDPTVDRQSGFLKPQIGDSEILGSSAYIPYFYVISDKSDMTLKPRLYTKDKFTLQTEYREVTENSANIFDVSLTTGHASSKTDQDDNRSHFFSNSMIDLNFKNFDYSNLEIQLQKTSNDTYLKLFNFETPLITDASTLNSFIKIDADSDDLSFNSFVQVYEKLGNADSDRYEYILPSYNLTKFIDINEKFNGTMSFSSAGSQNIRDTNITESQIINDLSYLSENIFSNNGIMSNYNLLLKNVNTDGKNSSKYKNEKDTKILSSIMFESSYPLIREGMNYNNFLTPKISLKYSPNNMKNLQDEDRKLNTDNVFSMNRLGFSDVVESGQSITIGGEYKKTSKDNNNDLFKLNVATVFRDEFEEDYPKTSSLGKTSSDIMGSISLSPNEIFDAKYNFSLDNNLDQLKYNDLSGSFTVNNFVTEFNYYEENENIGDEAYIQNTTSLIFNENSSISFSTRKNKKIDLTEYYNLIYQYKNDCLTAAIKYKKDFYADNDVEPTEELYFSLTIVPLGAYETANVIKE